jgi:hypothetical protein
MMEDVVWGGNFPHTMLREFSWLMELQRAWGVFVLTNKTLPVLQIRIPDWELYGTGQKCHPSLTLNKLTRETAGEEWPSYQKILPGNWHKSAWRLEGEGPWRECLWSPTNQEIIGCDVTVGSLPLELGQS